MAIGHFFGEDEPRPVTQVSLQNSTPQKTVQPKTRTTIQREVSRPRQTTPKTLTQPAQRSKTMYVDASSLRVRAGPGLNNKQVWTLKCDQQVATYQQQGDWIFVKGDRFSGWVHGGYLTPNKSQRKTQPIQKVKPQLSDKKIIEILIARSHGLYSGNCPCPYNRARNGSRCGKRSAYSRPGGASPLCYASDVSRSMINDYRARQ